MAIQARMVCTKTESICWSQYVDEAKQDAVTVTLKPVYAQDSDDPNLSYSEATPDGSFALTITNKAAFGQFEAGGIYNIEIRKHTPGRSRAESDDQ